MGALLTLQFNRLRMKSKVFSWLGKSLKSQMYTVLSVENILCRRAYNHRLRVSSDSYQGTVESSALFICNQQRLGGDLWVAPRARNTDGQFDVLIVPKTNPTELLEMLTEMKLGRPPKVPSSFPLGDWYWKTWMGARFPFSATGRPCFRISASILRSCPGCFPVYRSGVRGGSPV